MSCSLPLPPAIFCASAICDFTASSLKSSSGYPSTAFILRTEFGWTMANPPETVSTGQHCSAGWSTRGRRTEILFAPATFLNNLNQARFQLLDRRNVLCQDTHVARFRRNIHLDAVVDRQPLSEGSFMRENSEEHGADGHIGGLVDRLGGQMLASLTASFSPDAPGEGEPKRALFCRRRHQHSPFVVLV